MITEKNFLTYCRKKDDGGFNEIKEYIDNKGKFKSIKGGSGTTPLHTAARSNSIKIVELLVDKGMNPMVRDKTQKGKTPIVDALEKDNAEMALILISSKIIKPLKAKKRYNEFSALSKAKISINDYKKVLGALLKAGFNASELDYEGYEPLTKAIQQNNFEKIKVCVEDFGFDVNNPNRNPLNYSLYRREHNNEIIKYLLNKGSKIISNDGYGYNSLEVLINRNNSEMVKYVIDNYEGLELISNDDTLIDDILEEEDIEILKLVWEIPRIQKHILDTEGLESALPQDIKDVFIF